MPAPTAGRVAQEAVIRVAGDGLTSVRPYCRCSSSKRSLHRKGANCSGRTTNCKGVLLTAVPSMGYGLQNIRSKIATRDHVRDCVFRRRRTGLVAARSELLPACQFETILASEFAGGVWGDGFG